jgi:hypothetical protein
MTDISEQSVKLVAAIKDFDYYQHLYRAALVQEGISEDLVLHALVPDQELCSLWNRMWSMLPDHPAIHRAPFSLLCDLCEQIEED